MLQSVSTTVPAGPDIRPARSGILENQLSKYEVQLADWCACPSGKTPEGKKKIADLRDKVNSVRVQLQRIETARARAKDLESAAAAKSDSPAKAASSDFPAKANSAAASSSMGGLVDVQV